MSDLNFLSRHRRRTGNPAVYGVDPPNNANLVWRVDPDIAGAGAFVTGPAGTLSTPVQTSGARGHYSYGDIAADVITYGDSLDSTWTGGAWTLYLAGKLSAGDDQGGHFTTLLTKHTDASHSQFGISYIRVGNSALFAATVSYAGVSTRKDTIGISGLPQHIAALGRFVVVVTFDPALARGQRLKMAVGGVPPQNTGIISIGADGTMSDTTAVLTQGINTAYTTDSLGTTPAKSPAETSYILAYSGVQSTEQIAENVEWFKQYKGWG